MLETRSHIDEKLYKLNGNSNEWRLSEEYAFLEALNQHVAETLFYGNTDVHPERFMGLAPRYNAYQQVDNKLSTYNVVNGGGTGSNNTSIWFCNWSPQTLFSIFPKGSTAGLQVNDKGQQEITNEDGGRWTAIETQYQWDIGLALKDWRSCVRIANLDVEKLRTNSGAADLYDLMSVAHRRMRTNGIGRPVIYVGTAVLEALDRQSREVEKCI